MDKPMARREWVTAVAKRGAAAAAAAVAIRKGGRPAPQPMGKKWP